MELVDFILGNPLVIAGIIFVLSSLLGKKKKDRQQRQQKEKPVSPEPSPSIDQTQNRMPVKDRMQEAIQSIESRYQAAKTDSGELGQEIGSATEEIKTESVNVSVISQPERTKANPVIDKNNVVQGFIWSEILGSPRSKKPHPSAKRRV